MTLRRKQTSFKVKPEHLQFGSRFININAIKSITNIEYSISPRRVIVVTEYDEHITTPWRHASRNNLTPTLLGVTTKGGWTYAPIVLPAIVITFNIKLIDGSEETKKILSVPSSNKSSHSDLAELFPKADTRDMRRTFGNDTIAHRHSHHTPSVGLLNQLTADVFKNPTLDQNLIKSYLPESKEIDEMIKLHNHLLHRFTGN